MCLTDVWLWRYIQINMGINGTNFLYYLSDIRKRAFAFLQKRMKQVGVADIPPSYGDILYAIKQRGVVSQKEICELSYRDKSTVSLILNAIEEKGYIVKEKDKTDSRALRIKLTRKAEQKSDDMMAISAELQQKLFNGMSEEEKQIFFMLLNKIAQNI